MANVLFERLRQGSPTVRLPKAAARLPERFRGRPRLDPSRCPQSCRACVESCPTGAVTLDPWRVDLGACIFCGRCEDACTASALRRDREHRLVARSREELVVGAAAAVSSDGPDCALDGTRRRLLCRSLKLRQVSAGGCNGCEAELTALGNVVFDVGRFGIQFVASPRHADGIVVTGPVTPNMELALHDTCAAVPPPRVVIAVGACAITGGLFAGADGTQRGVPRDIAVDAYIPGCPPHPLTLLDGLLALLGRR